MSRVHPDPAVSGPTTTPAVRLAPRLRELSAQSDGQLGVLCPRAPVEGCTRELVASGLAWESMPVRLREEVGELLHGRLTAPVRYLIEAGGQRWRYGLMLQAVEALGGDSRRVAGLAASVEIMHTGSLVIDDIEDGAPLRRGQRAAHRVFGLPTGLNAGTAAYFAPDRVIRRIAADDVVLRAGLYESYLEALRAAHAGQALDIEGHQALLRRVLADGDSTALLERVRLTHRLKSGAVLGASMDMAAQVMAVSPHVRAALAGFGEAVGSAYQITDDVADLRGARRAGRVTKRVGEDVRNGKVTMPLAHAVRLLPAEVMVPLWERICAGQADERTVREVKVILDRCGALRACEREAEALLDRAWQRLEPLLASSEQTKLLHAMARHVVGSHRVA